MSKPDRIAPTEANPLPNPPISGNWVRAQDGALQPADDATRAAWHATLPDDEAVAAPAAADGAATAEE